MSGLKIQIVAGTDVGLVRTNNEDNVIVSCNLQEPEWTIPQAGEPVSLGEYGSLLVVADGMGGANAGEVASAMAIETVSKRFIPEVLAEVIKDDGAIQTFLIDTVKEADINIADEAKENKEHEGMGTTIVMAWIINDKVYVCWCGDSRAYVFNPTSGFTRLSKDHSFVQQLIDKGELDPANAHSHPYSNVITQCLGDASHRSEPEVRVCDLRHGDVILLCSDGLTSMCEDEAVSDVLIEHKDDDLNTIYAALLAAALDAGGHDNVTVALARMTMPDTGSKEQEPEDISSTIKPHQSSVPIECRNRRNVFVWIILLIVIVIAIAYFGTKGFTYLPKSPGDFFNTFDTEIQSFVQQIISKK